MKRLLTLALLLVGLSSPALAVPFAYTFITGSGGSNNTGSVHAIQTTSNLSEPIGTLVVFTGDIVGLNSSADAVVVTDAAGNTYTTSQCPQVAGSVNISFVSWSILTTALVAQKVTLSDTAIGGTNISAGGAMFMQGFVLTGAATSSPEDIAARACAGSTSSTTSPTVTSGTPTGAGEFFLSNYMAPQTSTSFAYTADAGHGWAAAGGIGGTTRQTTAGEKQTNAGATALIDNPVTTSAPYALQTVAFCPVGGCSVAGNSYGGGTTIGVGH